MITRLLILSSISSTVTAQQQQAQQQTVNCSQYQSLYSFQQQHNVPITVEYVTTSQNEFSAQVTYEGQGYVGLGVSPDGAMVGSTAVIGVPADNSVGLYDLKGYSRSSVALQNTLPAASILQNATHTVMTFSASTTDLRLTVDGSTANFFIVAAGASNTLGFHRHRSSVGLALSVCQEGAPSPSSATGTIQQAVPVAGIDNKQSLFQAHGWLAALAWGVIAPLAITSATGRALLPKAGLWFQLHYYLNVSVLIITTASFALVVRAIQATEGGGGHFQSDPGALGKHKTIGLVVTILVVLQAVAGIFRPTDKTSTVRKLWEFTHRFTGTTLLSMAFYQCHSGLILYAKRFAQSQDYVNVFWTVAGILTGLAVLGKVYTVFIHTTPTEQNEEAATTRPKEITEGASEDGSA